MKTTIKHIAPWLAAAAIGGALRSRPLPAPIPILPCLIAARKTVIVITHDDRYFGCVDQLVKLDFGQIAAVK